MSLIDQYGNPIKLASVAEPQTSRIATLQNVYIASHLDRISPASAGRILREADNGNLTAQHQLFDDMVDRDAHLACEFGKRTGAILGLDWAIEPPANASDRERKTAAWAEEILRDVVDDLDGMLMAMMEATGHGFAAIELAWDRYGGEYLPTFHPRPQTWFRLSNDRRELRLMDGSYDGAALIPFGWIMHQPSLAKTGYLGRVALCRCLIWPFIYKHYAVGDFAEFLETYGLPIILGKYYNGASPAEKTSLMRAVTALGHDARAIMPKEMEMEIAKITGSGDGDPHLKMVDWAERSQSKAILGQTLSAEAHGTGMGSGVADLHADVRRDILKSDAKKLAGTLTRDLVYPLLTLNGKGGDAFRRCPRWVFDLGEATDLKIFAETLPILAQNGARISVAWVHEKLRIPEAKPGDAIFGQGLADDSAPPEENTASLKAMPARTEEDAIDALIAAESWQPLLDPMLQPVRAALDEAAAMGETAEEFIARLPALMAKMDVEKLADALTRMAFTARLAGEAGLDTEDS
ncbi:MAG: DUF935 domain-containing protein [Zoogloeaceae bacterium]|jgi:phage gp29-like protein|nr:DUF935 domain-containing protein [Zoogloeaceae bacterium]